MFFQWVRMGCGKKTKNLTVRSKNTKVLLTSPESHHSAQLLLHTPNGWVLVLYAEFTHFTTFSCRTEQSSFDTGPMDYLGLKI